MPRKENDQKYLKPMFNEKSELKNGEKRQGFDNGFTREY
jgi:hypothetical protein